MVKGDVIAWVRRSLMFIDDVTADQSSRMNTGDGHRAILCAQIQANSNGEMENSSMAERPTNKDKLKGAAVEHILFWFLNFIYLIYLLP